MRGEGECARIAPASGLDIVVGRRADRDRWVGHVRNLEQEFVQLVLQGIEPCLVRFSARLPWPPLQPSVRLPLAPALARRSASRRRARLHSWCASARLGGGLQAPGNASSRSLQARADKSGSRPPAGSARRDRRRAWRTQQRQRAAASRLHPPSCCARSSPTIADSAPSPAHAALAARRPILASRPRSVGP